MGKPKRPSRARSKVPSDMVAIVATLQEGEDLELQDLAKAYTAESMGTLMKAQRSPKAPWSSRISAANSVLEYGHGRANTRESDQNPTGLTVIINQLSTGEQRESRTPQAVIERLEADVIEIERVPGKITINTDEIAAALESG